MAKLLRQNVGGVEYTMAGCALTGVCASAASDFIKAVALSDGDHLSDGMSVVVTFANGNTAGNAPVPITIYSSDQTNYYSDSGMTVPFTLAPSGCYDLEYSGSGNAYSYMSYPVIQVGGVSAPLCNAQGKKASGAVWLAGDKVTLLYNDNSFIVIPQAGDTLTATTASVTVYGKPLRTGSTVRIMFTADITGANTTSVLTLTYNGVDIPVKVGKNGSLSDFVASEVSTGVYKYVQAYTTLELMFDGTQFIIIGNPVVLSNADYTIYADGLRRVNNVIANSQNMITSGAVYENCLTKDAMQKNYFTMGQDLNTVKSGIWCAQTDAIGISLLNKPENVPSCTLFAWNNGGTTLYQVLISGNGKLYTRVCFDGAGIVWQPWRIYSNTQL